MADIKTHLRELSVATTLGLLKSEIAFTIEELYDPKKFMSFATQVINSNLDSASNIKDMDSFNRDLRQIINNGINLAKSIYKNKHFNIESSDVLTWEGGDTNKDDPIDIKIGSYGFSLKEESFILENMGLYKLVNCFTGSNYKKRHIFKDYANSEYQKWFSDTWGELTCYLKANSSWSFSKTTNKKTKIGKIILDSNGVILEYYENGSLKSQTSLPLICDLKTFESDTNSDIREQVFSKFINQELKSSTIYLESKKHCAETASNNLASELMSKLKYDAGLPRFLRIHDIEYYYAKTTSSGIEIFRVPAKSEFIREKNIIIEEIKGSVPDTQANILTTIKNTNTNQKLVLRNECRFSHGQFNGTPEAKMYYAQGNSLEAIYEKV
ncbi:hypothetical protein ACEE12_05205 [Streptococcus suis]